MDRTITPVARALKLALALALICCLAGLPGLDARAEPGGPTMPAAPGKRRDAAAPAAASPALPQAPALADSASQPAPAISSTAFFTPTAFLYLPLVRAVDPYADWRALGQPAGSAVAVNYLYVSQQCAGDRPALILAGTDAGLYSYGTGWTLNPGLAANISVSQIFSTTQGELYVSSFQSGLWRSLNGGASWAPDPLPNNDAKVYGLAQNSQYLYAGSSLGLYRRSSAGGAWSQIQTGKIYAVATVGSKVYAIQLGANKDTLLISSDGGTTWPIARQLPGVDFMQSLDADPVSGQVLIGAFEGGVFTLDSANKIVPFAQGLSQTVFAFWRDAQSRIYTAADTGGGLRRFAPTGGASTLDLSALPTGGSLAAQALFTVNGSTSCNIIAVGSESGGVWMRRVP